MPYIPVGVCTSPRIDNQLKNDMYKDIFFSMMSHRSWKKNERMIIEKMRCVPCFTPAGVNAANRLHRFLSLRQKNTRFSWTPWISWQCSCNILLIHTNRTMALMNFLSVLSSHVILSGVKSKKYVLDCPWIYMPFYLVFFFPFQASVSLRLSFVQSFCKNPQRQLELPITGKALFDDHIYNLPIFLKRFGSTHGNRVPTNL